MPNRLSILHVLAPGEAGGMESVVRLLAVGHTDRGHAVRVAAIVERDSRRYYPYLVSLQKAGVEVVPLALRPRAYIRERTLVAELCRRYRPSVVHTHGYRTDVVDAGVARRLGFPTITTVHGFGGGKWRNRFYERLQQLAFRTFDAVVVVSRPLAERLAESGVRRDRIHLVPNAYTRIAQPLERSAARRELSLSKDQFVVGWVGRLSREKGADILVKALAQLPSVPVTISVLGDGPEHETLNALAAALGVQARITWHGVVHDAASFFPAFDAFVLSSRSEGTPMVLLEAMSAGVPIVATRVGGVPDVVSPSEAFLVPPEDPTALADALLDVYRNPERAASRARAARERLLTDFQPAPWLTQYETLYRGIQRLPAGKES